jgi:regulator of sigma E protease
MTYLASAINIALIVLGFGVLIFIHELGHFIAAKWARIRTEAFAIGMGPVVCSWRKGIGFRFGSTAAETERRVEDYLKREADVSIQFKEESTEIKLSPEQINRAMDALRLGETEYSLRWLPIGGFVKMLGQEDANPNYVSDDPRSYNRCPIGKRMIVVSAGVLMNLLLAVIVFIVAFMVGVRMEAPVVGDLNPDLTAATTMADNAEALGVTSVGLQPGDEVLTIDGKPAQTFADLQIASAMSRPGVPTKLTVKRAGLSEPLQFTLLPKKDVNTGLLSFGIAPGASTTLINEADDVVNTVLKECGLSQVKPGMSIVRANGQSISTFQQVLSLIEGSDGRAVMTEWTSAKDKGQASGEIVEADLPVEPAFQILRVPDAPKDAIKNYDEGLFGLTPLVRIREVLPGSANEGILRKDDLILRIAGVDGPRLSDLFEVIKRQPIGPVPMTVLRDGEVLELSAQVQRRGLFKSAGVLNIALESGWDVPIIAEPMDHVQVAEPSATPGAGTAALKTVVTPAAAMNLPPRTRIDAVGGVSVSDWASIREQLRDQTQDALDARSGASVPLLVTHPTPGRPQETVQLALSADEIAALHKLGWRSELPQFIFDPVFTVRSAGGNPLKALAMGFEETYKMVIMTYLTIDRLFRGSVGVDQLRGPVGIVHLGTKVLQKGWMYSFVFLAMISVNLAVINFLPLPIVDGGLFLFLIYEKLKGRPPSIAFQNVATIIGLCIIGALFVVTFYNDVLRLFS